MSALGLIHNSIVKEASSIVVEGGHREGTFGDESQSSLRF